MGRKMLLAAVAAIVLAIIVNKFYFEDRPSGDIIQIRTGKVQGTTGISREGRVYSKFLGIPYAKPPLGKLRFESPQPADSWDGVLDASKYRSECPQFEFLTRALTGNEDCLFLNVFTPKTSFENEASSLMPVMVFIHGGYFEHGGGDLYKPTYFMDEDVVIVTLNYRLHVLGFLSTGDDVVRGNMGLKDQTLALKWVRENIRTFGGNPNQVTVFGESAGSASVHLLMMSPLSQGLVSRAISQSGSAFSHWAMFEDPQSQIRAFAKRTNCDSSSNKRIVECLRKLDIKVLMEALSRSSERYKIDVFVPVVENYVDEDTFLPDTPENMYANGRVGRIPWLTGVNSLEGLLFSVAFQNNRTMAERVKHDWTIFEDCVMYLPSNLKKHSQKIREYYFGRLDNIDPNENFQAVAELVSDRNYFSVITKAVDLHKQVAPVYPYWLSKEGPSFTDLFGQMTGRIHRIVDAVLGIVKMYGYRALGYGRLYKGVSHADDLVWLFEIPPLFWISTSNEYYTFSRAMVKAWVMFAKGDHPQLLDQQMVKIGRQDEVKFLLLDDKPKTIDYPHVDRLNFWQEIYRSE